MKYEELLGKYLNGFFITKVEKDPFIKGQINLWTDSTKEDFLHNREVVKFYVREYSSGASIYREQVDKEIVRLHSVIKEAREYIKSNEFIGRIRLSSENKEAINKLLEILGSDKE